MNLYVYSYEWCVSGSRDVEVLRILVIAPTRSRSDEYVMEKYRVYMDCVVERMSALIHRDIDNDGDFIPAQGHTKSSQLSDIALLSVVECLEGKQSDGTLKVDEYPVTEGLIFGLL